MRHRHLIASQASAAGHGAVPVSAIAAQAEWQARRRPLSVLARAGARGALSRDAYPLWRLQSAAMAEPALRAVATRLIAATLSAAISLGVLGAVAESFLSRGMPFERLVALERSCADNVYASERDACVRAALAVCAALRRDLSSRQC